MPDSQTLLDMWYKRRKPWLSALLLPLSWLFQFLAFARRFAYRRWLKNDSLPVPVIVVGNITLGGSGKSPLLMSLACRLRQQGYSPGIISRGYGSRAPYYPFTVDKDTPVIFAGDEPLMIARRTGCPVVIDSDRLEAAKCLIDSHSCDLILSDDGLQHYGLPRDVEIVVVDGQRLLGNRRLLPAGPLRETPARLQEVDWVVLNGTGRDHSPPDDLRGLRMVTMELRPFQWRRLDGDQVVPVDGQPWSGSAVHAVAGIGNPQRFFDTLEQLGLTYIPHVFPDHYQFEPHDLAFADHLPVVMTEKDAVKCGWLLDEMEEGSRHRYWYLAVEAELDNAFCRALEERLAGVSPMRNQASTCASAGK